MVLVMLKATLTAGEILVLCDQRIEWGRGGGLTTKGSGQ